MAVPMNQNNNGSLGEMAKRWSVAMRASDRGPLEIATEVMRVVDDWETHRADAGGRTADAWLTESAFRPGLGVTYWCRRRDAVAELGRDAQRTLHHDVAVWLHGIKPASVREALFWALLKRTRETNRGACLSMSQARRVYREVVGQTPKAKPSSACRCDEFRALLAKHGIAVE